jgi:hypothetical protein
MTTKRVIAGKFGPCPMEKNGRRYIGDVPVTVEITAYYARRLMHGDLVEYVDPPVLPPDYIPPPPPPPAKAEKDGEEKAAPGDEPAPAPISEPAPSAPAPEEK